MALLAESSTSPSPQRQRACSPAAYHHAMVETEALLCSQCCSPAASSGLCTGRHVRCSDVLPHQRPHTHTSSRGDRTVAMLAQHHCMLASAPRSPRSLRARVCSPRVSADPRRARPAARRLARAADANHPSVVQPCVLVFASIRLLARSDVGPHRHLVLSMPCVCLCGTGCLWFECWCARGLAHRPAMLVMAPTIAGVSTRACRCALTLQGPSGCSLSRLNECIGWCVVCC